MFSKSKAGVMVKAGTNRLGKDISDLMIERQVERKRLEKECIESS